MRQLAKNVGGEGRSHFMKPKINVKKKPNLKLKKAFLGMAQKPETTMKNRGKTKKPKNLKLQIAKKTP